MFTRRSGMSVYGGDEELEMHQGSIYPKFSLARLKKSFMNSVVRLTMIWFTVAMWCIWLHRYASSMGQVIACCLSATSHYLPQCQLMITGVLYHSLEINLQVFNINNFEKYTHVIISISPRGQWVTKHRFNMSDISITRWDTPVHYTNMKPCNRALKIGFLYRLKYWK